MAIDNTKHNGYSGFVSYSFGSVLLSLSWFLIEITVSCIHKMKKKEKDCQNLIIRKVDNFIENK